MLQQFIYEIESQSLFTSDDTILLAVSGGMDSVVMCELFYRANYKFAIAHCNFHLRPNDSDVDEKFVEQLAKKYNVSFYSASFDTIKYASDNKLSIEEAARNLRYNFFEQILSTHGYAYVATAHHRDDAIETFFLNLMRGTGIVGLHGILHKNANVIRPLLAFGRDEIEHFVNENNLDYRTDYTNATLDYKRNKVRHLLHPLLRKLSPAFDKTMQNNMRHIADVEKIYKDAVEKKRVQCLKPYKNGFKISIKELENLHPLRTYLYEFLSPFGFGESAVLDIIDACGATSGKKFYAKNYYLIKDRECLFVYPLVDDGAAKDVYITADLCRIELPIPLTFEYADNADSYNFDFISANAYFDADKIQFPLCLRKWKQGDKFQPFGMKGKRKVSDFFTDAKLSIHDKKDVWLLCSATGEIMWIVGMRTDDRFKITPLTKKILRVIIVDKDEK